MSHEESPVVTYGEGATFVRQCPKCNRYVKAYKKIRFDYQGQPIGHNARCTKHGKIEMYFIGYY